MSGAHVSPLCVCGQPLSAHAVCGQYDGGCWESRCDEFKAAAKPPAGQLLGAAEELPAVVLVLTDASAARETGST